MLNDLIPQLCFNPIIGLEIEFYLIPQIATEINLCDFYNNKHAYITKESGVNQFEFITVPFSDLNLLQITVKNFKEKITRYAQEHNYLLSFDAKPFKAQPSSGLHINISFEDFEFLKNNIMYAIGGLLLKITEDIRFFINDLDDKKRFIDNSIESPSTICWGFNNRSAAIRIPVSDANPQKYRIEHRVCAPAVNIEKAIEKILFAIDFGIKNKITPPKPTYGLAHDPQYSLPKIIDLENLNS
jgi:glutamine synthetase